MRGLALLLLAGATACSGHATDPLFGTWLNPGPHEAVNFIAPTGLSPTDGTVLMAGTSSVRLSWNSVDGAAGYLVRVVDETDPQLRSTLSPRDCAYVCTLLIADTSLEVPLVAGHLYTLGVSAARDVGHSGPEAQARFSVASPIASAVIVGPGSGAVFHGATRSIRLSWNAVANATGYHLRVADQTDPAIRDPRSPAGCAYLCLDNYVGTEIDLPVVPGHAYVFWVHTAAGSEFSAASWVVFQVARRPPLPIPDGSLKYFGYWDCCSPRPFDEVLSEQSGYVNTTMYLQNFSLPALEATLAKVEEHRLQVVLHWPFFDRLDVGSPLDPAELAAWAARVTPIADRVIAVSMADEPDCNYRGATFPGGWTPENCQAQKRRLELNIATMKSVLPNAPAWVNYTTAWVNGLSLPASLGYELPSNGDWFSFDCYTAWENCFASSSVAQMTAVLDAKLSGAQKIAFIPRAFQGEFGGYTPSQATTAGDAERYYQVALSNPRVVAILPFLWWSFAEVGAGDWIGARNSPLIRAKYEEIGHRIIDPGLDCRVGFTGRNNTVGLPNGDARFLCLENQWFDCGWEGTDAWEVEAQPGQRIGNWTCSLTNGWVATP